MRQRGPDQELFRKILQHEASGTLTMDDWKELSARSLEHMSPEAQKEFTENSVMLCARNEDLMDFNIFNNLKLKGRKAVVKAHNNSAIAASSSASKAGGIPNSALLSEDARIMLTSNLWKEAGLVNGAIGKVVKICYSEDEPPPKHQPKVILVQFNDYKGPSCLEDMEGVVPITVIERQWFAKGKSQTRRGFPLAPAYAITIHKVLMLSIQLSRVCNQLTCIIESRHDPWKSDPELGRPRIFAWTHLHRNEQMQNIWRLGIWPNAKFQQVWKQLWDPNSFLNSCY